MKISLIVSDIDGTILSDEVDQDRGIEQLSERIREFEIPFTLASGRTAFMMEELRKQLGITLPMIICNGAGACDDNGSIWNEYLDIDQMRPVIELADELGLAVIVSGDGEETVYRQNEYTKARTKMTGEWSRISRPETEEEWKGYLIQKLLIIDPETPGHVDQVIEKLCSEEGNYQVLRYDDRGVEIMPKGCTKGHGVKRLADYLGIPLEEVMVIGDHKNDVEMFQTAGFGAAVNNAVPELKEHAHYVCESRSVYGVIEVADRFFIKGESA